MIAYTLRINNINEIYYFFIINEGDIYEFVLLLNY
jgi:hypothetical protein